MIPLVFVAALRSIQGLETDTSLDLTTRQHTPQGLSPSSTLQLVTMSLGLIRGQRHKMKDEKRVMEKVAIPGSTTSGEVEITERVGMQHLSQGQK